MEVVVVGEDQATKEVLYKLISYVGGINVLYDLPVRGGRIKSLTEKFNNLSLSVPVLLLTDLDQYSCAPELLSRWFEDISRNPEFHIRIAVDEAEAWLMADREGFSDYFKVPIESIPHTVVLSKLKPTVNEMNFPYKSSLYLIKEIIPRSRSKMYLENLVPKLGSKKGELYNYSIIPFIKNHWNVEDAMENSNSLRRTIARFRNL